MPWEAWVDIVGESWTRSSAIDEILQRMMDASAQFVTICHQGLRLSSRAVQCPPSARTSEVKWWREPPTQMIDCPCHSSAAAACESHHLASLHGYEACDNCCEDRIERDWSFLEHPTPISAKLASE